MVVWAILEMSIDGVGRPVRDVRTALMFTHWSPTLRWHLQYATS